MRTALVLVAASGSALADPAADAASAGLSLPGPTPDTDLVAAYYHHEPPVELPWVILNLPEHVVTSVFMPFQLGVRAIEGKGADQPFRGTPSPIGRMKLKFAPRVSLTENDGLGLGLGLAARGPSLPATLSAGATIWLDRDWLVDAQAARSFGGFENRVARLSFRAEHDADERYYGRSGQAPRSSVRALENNDQSLALQADLHPSDRFDLWGYIQAGVERQTLDGGTEAPPVAATDPDAPPAFAATTYYGTLTAALRTDTRDTIGRPSQGKVIELAAALRSDFARADLAAATLRLQATWYLQVLPESRALILTAGAAAALPLYPDATIPLSSLPQLGRNAHLRGYDRARFRDTYATWASIEYRWPVYEYRNSNAGLDAFLFVDSATAFGDATLEVDAIRYSTGGGFKIAHETTEVGAFTAGWSPEGWQLTFVTTYVR